MIDLQIHSTFSDGSLTPTELVKEAKAKGLSAIALTDHDTIDGLPEFMAAGKKDGVITVPGVEISVDIKLPNHGHMHILGLFINPYDKDLKSKLEFLRTERNKRAEKIIQKLNDLGLKVTLEELLAEAGEGSIGRPHIAKIMLRRGFVSTIQEAFNLYLGKGKPAYVDKVKFGEEEAIKMIKNANGLTILAHPHLMKYDSLQETQEKILALKTYGLDGLETYYSTMTEEYSQALVKFAQENQLVISGGSDYHGNNKDGIFMGIVDGQRNIPDSVYHNLKKYWERQNRR